MRARLMQPGFGRIVIDVKRELSNVNVINILNLLILSILSVEETK